MDPLIVTLALDAGTEAWLEWLRQAHFPPALNLVPAHVTLFHALPGEEHAAVLAGLREACAGVFPCGARVGPAYSLGRGVALRVEAPRVAALRAGLAARWAGWLTRQDAQAWRGHATVQNKVAPVVARATLAELVGVGRDVCAEGVRVWWYRGGGWDGAGEVG